MGLISEFINEVKENDLLEKAISGKINKTLGEIHQCLFDTH